MSVVVMGSAAVVVPMRAVDVNVEVIRVFKFAVDMMVPRVETVQRIFFWLLDGIQVRLLVWVMMMMCGEVLVVADSKIRAHSKHVKDICWVYICWLRNWLVLMREHALPIFPEVLTSEVVGDILITMGCVSLVRGEEVVLIAWINHVWQGIFCGFPEFADRMMAHRGRR
jgi:hypothetical protein